VLLVEDDPAIRESLAECLSLEGLSVHEAADGVEALEWLAGGNRPGVVVLDLVMPRMGGAELLEHLRASPATCGLKVVLTSAAAPERGGHPQADAEVAKPFEFPELLAALRRLLAGAGG
jgi:CheY-like chemotaxis protein